MLTDRFPKLSAFWQKWYGPIWGAVGFTSLLTLKYSPPQWTVLEYTALGGLAVAIIGFLAENSSSFHGFKEKLDGFDSKCPTRADLGQLTASFDNLAAAQKVELCNISSGLGKLKAWMGTQLASCGDDIIIEIDHLGLDMDVAHEEVEKLIVDTPHLRQIDFRCLIMDHNPSAFGPNVPTDVHKWSKNAEKGLIWLEDLDLRAKRNEIQGRKVGVQYHTYNELPVFHGFVIRKPFFAYCVSYCRWKQSLATLKYYYDWGDEEYRVCLGKPQEPQLLDLFNSFQAQFEHLWNVAVQPRTPPQPPVQVRGSGDPA